MRITPNTRRIHPLIAVAAVSVTLVSLMGIAAITGVLPNSHGSTSNVPSLASQADYAPTPVPATTHSDGRELASHKTVAHRVASNPVNDAQVPVDQMALSKTTQRPAPMSAPQQQTAAPHNSPLGIGVGAVIGGLLGNQVGSGDGKTLATIAGAVGGGYLGNEIAKRNQ